MPEFPDPLGLIAQLEQILPPLPFQQLGLGELPDPIEFIKSLFPSAGRVGTTTVGAASVQADEVEIF